MAGLASYFIKDKNMLIPENKYIIKGKTYRFSILTPRLIRLEYSKDGKFVDGPSELVWYRNMPKVDYTLKLH